MNDLELENFDLLIEQIPGSDPTYRARVIRSLAEHPTVDFHLPFSVEQLQSFVWLANRQFRNLKLAKPISATEKLFSHATFGTSLYGAIFQGKLEEAFNTSKALAQERDKRLCLRLFLDEPELVALPWEYLCPPQQQFLALEMPVVRCLSGAAGGAQPALTQPLRVLAVLASPQGVEPLAVEEEWQRLQKALTGLQSQEMVVLERLEQPTLSALQTRLGDFKRPPVHILHFIGHGYFRDDGTVEEGGLVFADEAGRVDTVSAHQLGVMLKGHRSLALVFLNACESAQSGDDDAFSGTAQWLLQEEVPAVIAMQFPVSDVAAILLAQKFYSWFAAGYPLELALTEGRKALFGKDLALEWATPVLCSRLQPIRRFEVAVQPAVELTPYVATPYPRTKRDLEESQRTIPDKKRVTDPIYAPHQLTLGGDVEAQQTIYASADVVIGKRCHLQQHLIGDATIAIDDGGTVNGTVWSNGEHLVVGKNCTVHGGIWAAETVSIGDACRVSQVVGHDVTIGADSYIGSVTATGNLTLLSGVTLERCKIGGMLVLPGEMAQPVTIRQMDTLVVSDVRSDAPFALQLREQRVTNAHIFRLEKHLFGAEKYKISPYDPQSKSQTMTEGQRLVISSLLDQEWVQATQEPQP